MPNHATHIQVMHLVKCSKFCENAYGYGEIFSFATTCLSPSKVRLTLIMVFAHKTNWCCSTFLEDWRKESRNEFCLSSSVRVRPSVSTVTKSVLFAIFFWKIKAKMKFHAPLKCKNQPVQSQVSCLSSCCCCLRSTQAEQGHWQNKRCFEILAQK